ncbi:hypothetical protein Q8F55_002421 [Vanrija albida]|uniref:Histone deacetylase domain-containing protein n=1 Tax=Vanrija albida TaxID=181172 RepID=A0ABR3Q9R7_9TREE
MTTAYLWSPALEAAADELPANRGRSSTVHALIRALGLVSDDGGPGTARVVAPDPALGSASELARYHARGYVEYLLEARGESESDTESDDDADGPRKRRRTMGLEHDCPPFPALPAYASLVAAATLTACALLARGEARTAVVWDGGRHHALKGRATPRARILYLDLDLHYGDGVAQAFASPTHFPHPLKGRPRPPQVLTLSVHHAAAGFFPPAAPGLTPADTPHPFSLSLPLAAYASSATYARLWASVERIKAAYRPHYVVLQLGVDGLPRDPVGRYGAWGVSGDGGVPALVGRVMAWGVPTAVLGGGGYDSANAARAWALATATLVGRDDLRPATDVPDHDGWEAYAPGYTLEVELSHIPDENTDAQLAAAYDAFKVLAARIAEIVDLHDRPV